MKEIPASVSTLAEGNNRFAFDIFKRFNQKDAKNNIFISPFSIFTALIMTMIGANGSTLKAMQQALYVNNIPLDTLIKDYQSMLVNIGKTEEMNINIANSIWIDESLGKNIKTEFIKTNRNYFMSDVFSMKLSSTETIDEINKWINKATEGYITEMLDKQNNSNDSLMYLINAVYFQGQWATPFEQGKTSDMDFTTIDGSVKVPMMYVNDKFQFAHSNFGDAVRLPYGNRKVSMTIVLPSDNIGFDEWISNMNYEQWNEILHSTLFYRKPF